VQNFVNGGFALISSAFCALPEEAELESGQTFLIVGVGLVAVGTRIALQPALFGNAKLPLSDGPPAQREAA
jgi:hypothetical protein